MLDHDRKVALEQLPRELRPAFSALWNLDLAFADVVSTSSDPHLGAIRLAWWRERLEDLDQGKEAPAEPRLQAVARELLQRAIDGRDLSKLEDGWLALLQPFPWGEEQSAGLKMRGEVLFCIGARLLGGDALAAAPVGAFWSLADCAQHCSHAASRAMLEREARVALSGLKDPLSPQLRPLTVLAALAATDLVREGRGLARLTAAVRHWLFGSLPRS